VRPEDGRQSPPRLTDNLRRVTDAQYRAELAVFDTTGEIDKLRQTITDADAKIRRYRDTLDAGAIPRSSPAGSPRPLHLVDGRLGPEPARRAPRGPGKVRAEADEVLGEHGLPADQAAMSRLRYAEAVVNEALRLRPAVPFRGFEPIRSLRLWVRGTAAAVGSWRHRRPLSAHR
jgi:hypothetical protein